MENFHVLSYFTGTNVYNPCFPFYILFFSKEAHFSTKTWLVLQRNVVLYPSHNKILNHYPSATTIHPSATSLVNLLRGVMLPANDWPLGLTSLESEGLFFVELLKKVTTIQLGPFLWNIFQKFLVKNRHLQFKQLVFFFIIFLILFFIIQFVDIFIIPCDDFPTKNIKISSRIFLLAFPQALMQALYVMMSSDT